jgi:tRNA uridine 5-carboxymethylaminomethyl modification enzyme
MLSRPEISFGSLSAAFKQLRGVPVHVWGRIENDAKYAVYVDRQRLEILSQQSQEAVTIPETINFNAVPGLSIEVRSRLLLVRPVNIAQASRIEGITPAAITILAAFIRKGNKSQAAGLVDELRV